MQITNEFDTRLAMGYQAAGTTDVNGNILDTQGASSLCFLAALGPIVSGGVQSLKVQHGDQSDLSDAADIDGAVYTIGDTDDDKLCAIEVARATKRYVRIVLLRETQNCTLYSVIALLGDLRKKPPANHSTFDGKTVVAS